MLHLQQALARFRLAQIRHPQHFVAAQNATAFKLAIL